MPSFTLSTAAPTSATAPQIAIAANVLELFLYGTNDQQGSANVWGRSSSNSNDWYFIECVTFTASPNAKLLSTVEVPNAATLDGIYFQKVSPILNATVDFSYTRTGGGGSGTDHNTLSNRQGGNVSQSYHLLTAEYSTLQGLNFASGPTAVLAALFSRTAISGGATIGATGNYFVVTAGSGNVTIPSPASPRFIDIKNNTSGTITLQPPGGATIDGQSNFQLLAGDSVALIADSASNWEIN